MVEKPKARLARLLSNLDPSNADSIADAIEDLIDHRIEMTMDRISEQMEFYHRAFWHHD
jgi:hypothetical protein